MAALTCGMARRTQSPTELQLSPRLEVFPGLTKEFNRPFMFSLFAWHDTETGEFIGTTIVPNGKFRSSGSGEPNFGFKYAIKDADEKGFETTYKYAKERWILKSFATAKSKITGKTRGRWRVCGLAPDRDPQLLDGTGSTRCLLIKEKFVPPTKQKSYEKHTYGSCLDYPSAALFCGDVTYLCTFQRIRRRIGQRRGLQKLRNWPRKPKTPSPTSSASPSRTTLISGSAPTTPRSGS